MQVRVGLGVDLHPWSDDPDRTLRLGGVDLPGPGLAGHSDADAVAHACADAQRHPQQAARRPPAPDEAGYPTPWRPPAW